MVAAVVYSGKEGDGFLSFEEAVQIIRDPPDGCDVGMPLLANYCDTSVTVEYGRGGVAYGSGDSGVSKETPSTACSEAPAAGEASYDSDDCSEGSEDSDMSATRLNELGDLRALTPVPEDSELPWLFMDTIRAAQTDTLRLAGQLKLDVEDFQPGLRERLHVRTYDGSPNSGTGTPAPQQPSFQSASSFAVPSTPGYSGVQNGSNFPSNTGFFGGGLQSAVSQNTSMSPTMGPNSNLPPSSSFSLQPGVGFMAPDIMCSVPFQPGYIGNPLHPGHFGGPNSM
jgi:hypothetical protein